MESFKVNLNKEFLGLSQSVSDPDFNKLFTSTGKSEMNKSEKGSETNQDFAKAFKVAFEKVNQLQKQANQKIQAFSTGKNKNIPEVMIAVERADVAFKLMMKVRNKVIEAYQEVMRMQI